MDQGIRRVVVGTEDGVTTVLHDGSAPATMSLPSVPGTVLTDIWRSELLPVPAPDGSDPTSGEFQLMPAGSLFRIIDLAPSGDSEPMWHQTESVDFIYLASGSAVLLHEQGEVELHEGDTVVVGGVRHAWVNRGTSTCRLIDVSATLGAPTD